MARISAAEKRKRYRERLKLNTEKYEEAKRKHREHYHKVKRLAKDLTPKEKKQANTIWKLRQREYRKKKNNLQSILDATPPSSPVPGVLNIYNQLPPASPASVASQKGGRKKVRKNKSKVHKENKKLQKENQKFKKICEKNKKRLIRKEVKERESENHKEKRNYKLLTNSVKERYERIKSHKEKRLLKSLFETDNIDKSRKKNTTTKRNIGNKPTVLFRPIFLLYVLGVT